MLGVIFSVKLPLFVSGPFGPKSHSIAKQTFARGEYEFRRHYLAS